MALTVLRRARHGNGPGMMPARKQSFKREGRLGRLACRPARDPARGSQGSRTQLIAGRAIRSLFVKDKKNGLFTHRPLREARTSLSLSSSEQRAQTDSSSSLHSSAHLSPPPPLNRLPRLPFCEAPRAREERP